MSSDFPHKAFDSYITQTPEEYFRTADKLDDGDLNAYQKAKKKAFSEGYAKGRHDERVAMFEKLVKDKKEKRRR